MRVAVDTDIAAPRPVVWSYIIHPRRHLEFMDGMTQWQIEGAQRNRLGARIAMRMRIGSAELGGRIEVVEFDPPCDMAWTSVTGVEHRGRWRLRVCDDGRTHVELRVTYHAPGGITGYLADLVALPIVKGHLQRSLNALKRQLEAPPRASSKRAPTSRHRAVTGRLTAVTTRR
jgi:uncharacterized membrane protein